VPDRGYNASYAASAGRVATHSENPLACADGGRHLATLTTQPLRENLI